MAALFTDAHRCARAGVRPRAALFAPAPVQMPELFDVLIIGGGVVGCAIARELTRYRLRVCLVEKECDVGFGTSKANSGIIHGGHHSDPRALKGRLEWEGNQMWDTLAADLAFGFKRIGELTVALSEAELPTLESLLHRGQAKGVQGLELWPADRVRAEEPNLSPGIIAALHAPTTGVVNPYEACFCLAESAIRNGLDLRTGTTVIGLSASDEIWTVSTDRGELQSRFVLNAAGLWAGALAGLAGASAVAIHPRKGEEYLLDKRLQGHITRVIFPCPTPVSKGILVIPTYDGTLMLGPTATSVDDPFDLTTSPTGSDEVFAAIRRIAPGISPRDVIAQFAGLRAAADGDDFVIGPTTRKGFINVAGIQSPGLTAAPAIAVQVVDLLRTEGLALALRDDFAPTLPAPAHFIGLSTEDQIALADRDPRYRRMSCRCEFITEGEILDAIGRGARTLDGIKFRTRAGMGRCQGGFCAARCMELLSRELNIPFTEVTKRGGGSWMALSREVIAAETLEAGHD